MTEVQKRRADRKRFGVVRWVVLLSVLAISTVLGLLHQMAPELRIVSVDALCPFGGVESLWAVLSGGDLLKRIAVGSFVLLGATVGLNLLFGRAFCGQFCPLGTLQELFGSLRERLGMARREIPHAVDVPARYLKYVVFVVFAWLSWVTASLIIRPYDPWVAYHHLTSPELFTSVGVGAVVLGVSLAGSFIYDRFFCKYLCPMGAFLGLFSKLGFYRVERNADACIDCGVCDTACPVNLEVSSATSPVTDPECIACGQCVVACPKDEALAVKSRRGSVLKPITLTLATAAVIFGVAGVSMALGDMTLTMPGLDAQMAPASATASPAAGQTPTGQVDVALIKGYMTMQEVAGATGIPVAEFKAQFGVTDVELTAPIKELAASHEWDTQAVRDWVAQKTGSAPAAPGSCE